MENRSLTYLETSFSRGGSRFSGFSTVYSSCRTKVRRLFTYFLTRDDYRALTHSDHSETGSKLRDSSCSQRFGGGQGLLSGTKSPKTQLLAFAQPCYKSYCFHPFELSSSSRGRATSACLSDGTIAHTSEVRMPSTCTISIPSNNVFRPTVIDKS